MIVVRPFDHTPDGVSVHEYELHAPTGARVRLMDFGAAILGIEVPDAHGTQADVALGLASLTDYLDNPACHGCTVGPSANRTDRGEVPLANATYQLPRNDGPHQDNNLHTDLAHGLHKRVWNAQVDEAANAVTFSIELPDGEFGLPGNRTCSVTYALAEHEGATQLTVRHRCATDATTFVNMTNHTYFNLTGHAAGSVAQHLVRIAANHYLPLRPDSVSAGTVDPVAQTPFDFRTPKPLGQHIENVNGQLAIARGYDHCFCIDGFDPNPSANPRPALHAEDPASGRTLDILITAPGAHLYTGNWLDDAHGKGGSTYGPHAGFAFEPEFYPDNLHQPSWPHPTCAPQHPYDQRIVYRFGARPARS